MSQDFTVVFAGPGLDLGRVVGDMAGRLQLLGFGHKPSVTCFEPDESVVRAPPAELEISFDAYAAGSGAIWNGCSTSFSSDGFTLDVVASRWQRAFLNVQVDANANAIRRSYRDGALRAYFDALVEIASAAQAEGGVGGFTFCPEPIRPEEIARLILNNPENPGYPSDIGVLRSSDRPKDAIEQFSSHIFRVVETRGYWVLVSHDFLQLLQDLEGQAG